MSNTLYLNPDLEKARALASLNLLISSMGVLPEFQGMTEDFNDTDASEHLDWEREQALRDCGNCGHVLADRVECDFCGGRLDD